MMITLAELAVSPPRRGVPAMSTHGECAGSYRCDAGKAVDPAHVRQDRDHDEESAKRYQQQQAQPCHHQDHAPPVDLAALEEQEHNSCPWWIGRLRAHQ